MHDDGGTLTVERAPTRRSVLGAAGAGGIALAAAACAPATGPTPAPSTPTSTPATPAPWPLDESRLLASRATFGPTPAVVDRIRSIGPAAWLDEQLAANGATAEARLGSSFPSLTASNAVNAVQRNTDQNVLFRELDHAMLLRAVYSENQLYEVMCDFWSNHFSIWRSAKWMTHLKTRDDGDVIRPHALGRFADMLKASARSPAMLVYLDNYSSNAYSPSGVNENWGRELLELHTLGIIKGEQVYTEADMRGVAKVMSGRTINWTDGPTKYDYRFEKYWHSRDAVSILGGQWSRPARTDGAQGEADGNSLLEFLARHPSTARHLAFKLCRRFVADDPPMTLVDRLASTYLANDTAIAPVLRELFLSPELRASGGQKVKRPYEWLVSALRATKAEIDSDPQGHASRRLREVQWGLGQPINERTTPDGYPETAAEWVSTEGLLKRWEWGARLARNKLTSTTETRKVVIDPAALLPSPLPATTTDLLTALADQVFQFPLPAPHATSILAALGVSPSAAATTITSNANNLQAVLGLLCAHPNFQRR